ncbi:hypothetical protein D9615_007429 [Tricholomella constricta]|uniref:RED-like N-terminal domain-containing protein n=1 Tax=Tricholomella constricta TaxID=117010 RepID=A0A8H5LXT7_9AGAR|nr:hypothetical protein D9615_007429 [Tricholomella constricta]
MDQDSFRRLLQTPHASSSSRGSFLPGFSASKPKAKVIDASQPAFKPRKLKKGTDEKYRDRAAERRVGDGNDYAQVEAVLEDFEKQHAGTDKALLDEQRRYLGGDGAHSVLVKGLDMALLEQNRARAAGLVTEDDESLERAFLEGAQPQSQARAQSTAKRTRADLIRELKAKRAQAANGDVDMEEGIEGEEREKKKTKEEEALLLERAKQAGRFKPIGFKPIGAGVASEKVTKKKKKLKGGADADGERKKKKRKVLETEGAGQKTSEEGTQGAVFAPPPSPLPESRPKPVEQEPELLPTDFDIFADAGEYEGLQLDSSEDGDDNDKPDRRPHDLEDGEEPNASSPTLPRRWIDTGSPEPEPAPAKPDLLASVLNSTSASASREQGKEGRRDREDGEEEEQAEDGEVAPPMRLVPLASSALPSIKEFLAMEEAASGGGKRRKRKGGAGGGGGERKGGGEDGEEGKKRAAEAKAERDYKRLKSYTDKKAAS